MQDGVTAFHAELETFVENISKSVNKAIILLNRFLISRLSQGESLSDLTNQTFYNNCINIGSGKCAEPADGCTVDTAQRLLILNNLTHS